MKISIIGTGYVGTVTGACFAELGHHVVFVDISPQRVAGILKGDPGFYEPGIGELLKKNSQRISATEDTKSAVLATDCTFIAVNTPSCADGSLDTTYIEKASEQIGSALRETPGWHTVIVKSTVLPGTIEKILVPALERTSGKRAYVDFGLCTNPEFLKEGCAIEDFLHTDRVIFGVHEEKSQRILEDLYASFSCPKIVTSLKTAEMIKYTSNAFLSTKISFSNEIGNICKALEIDSRSVFEGVGLDSRIGPHFFRSGIGFGGSCFPKDINALIALAKEEQVNPVLLNAVVSVNESQPERMIALLKRHMHDLNHKKIGVLGLSFKPDTDDIRESRAIPIIHSLLSEGSCVMAYDPVAIEHFKTIFPSISYAASAEEVLSSDAVLIVTEWDEFKHLDYREKLVIDGRKIKKAQEEAKIYEGVCW